MQKGETMKISEIFAAANTGGGNHIIGNVALIVCAGMTLIQIAPIKINPWSWIAKKIGRAINAELLKSVGEINKELVSIRADMARAEAVNARSRILRFGDECLHSGKHTKEHFDNILRDITNYDHYCAAHPEFENNVTKMTAQRIEEIYHRCLADNDFL